jgi:hypothetical protein
MLLGNQVGAARHFDHRWHEFMKWFTTDPTQPLGNIVDFFWRVEFQQRGSPHVHMLLWVDGAPNLDTPEGRAAAPAFIDQYVCTRIPPGAQESDSAEAVARANHLRDIVLATQIHGHRDTCYKNGAQGGRCRFAYPKPACDATRLSSPADQGLRKCDFYVTQRGADEAFVAPYNPACLCRWEANMDIQMIGGQMATAAYVCAYVAKAESAGLRQHVQDAVGRLPEGSKDYMRMLRVGTALLGLREYSLQEATFLMGGLHMRGASRSIVPLSVGLPKNRIRMLRSDNFGGEEDSNNVPLCTNVYDYYAARPTNLGHPLADLTLFNFVAHWQVSGTRPARPDPHCYEIAIIEEAGAQSTTGPRTVVKYIRPRAKAAVPRIAPRMSPESHGEEYFYSMVLLHVPWVSEDTMLLAYGGDARVAFQANEGAILQAVSFEQAADEIESAANRIREWQAELGCDNITDFLIAQMPPDNFGGVQLDPRYAAVDPQANIDGDPAWLGDDIGDHDVGGLGIDPNMVNIGIESAVGDRNVGRMSTPEFESKKASMNPQQRAILNDLISHVEQSRAARASNVSAALPMPVPLRWFVTGGAGTGKSYVIDVLHEYLVRAHPGTQACPVVLAAPTGVAAFNIGGLTVHSALDLPVERCRRDGVRRVEYKKLGSQRLAMLRAKWAPVHYLIIDEISMVSYETLTFIHRRLVEIKGTPAHVPFGGVSVIAVGDLCQLPPVKAPYVFDTENHLARTGGRHMWREHFEGRALESNVRQQHGSSWAEVLNALRHGTDETAVTNAFNVLSTRLLQSAGGPLNIHGAEWDAAPRLYARTLDVDTYNRAKLLSLSRGPNAETLYVVNAGHAVVQPNGHVDHSNVLPGWIPDSSDECGGLAATVMLARGARIMLRRNLRTEDGLVNGVTGTVVGFKWSDGSTVPIPNEPPAVILVDFDNPTVGAKFRQYNNLPPDAPVEIAAVTSVFEGNSRKRLQRTQFPISLAWALTIHRVQGLSMDRAVINLGRSIFAAGQAYVALSRVRTLEGVALESLALPSIQKVDPRVLAEYARLGIPFEVPSSPSAQNISDSGEGGAPEDQGVDNYNMGCNAEDGQPGELSSLEDTRDGLLHTREGVLSLLGVAAVAAIAVSSLQSGEEEVLDSDSDMDGFEADLLRAAGYGSSNAGDGRDDGPCDYMSDDDDDDRLSPYRRQADLDRSPRRMLQPQVVEGIWMGHDMCVWPPTNIWTAAAGAATFSWMYMPLIIDALGLPGVFTFPRPPWWAQVVAELQATFHLNGVTLASPELYANWDDPRHTHLLADYQNHLMGMLPDSMSQDVTFKAWSMVMEAAEAAGLPPATAEECDALLHSDSDGEGAMS